MPFSGQVTDLVINLTNSRVDYSVVSINGRTVLVPWSATVFDDSQALHFNGLADQLSNAPTFEQGGVDFSDQSWDQNYSGYWNNNSGQNSSTNSGSNGFSTTPQVSGSSGSAFGQGGGSSMVNSSTAILASQLLKTQVVANGFNVSSGMVGTVVPNTGSINSVSLGTIQDVVVNRLSGDIPWLLLGVNVSALGIENRLVPVPFNSLDHEFSGGILYLTIDPTRLQNAPNLDTTGLPGILGFGWDSSILNYWLGNNSFQPTQNP